MMKSPLSRRDFLKLAGMFPLSAATPGLVENLDRYRQAPGKAPNVLVVVFDALSAYNISLYGYSRDTMPNLSRLAERAIVYHNHYAGGNFTTPGTASLLTGVHPWTHRAFEHLGRVDESFIDKNIFNAFQNYHRIAFTHNPWVSKILDQFVSHLETYVPANELLITDDSFIPDLFNRDDDIAQVSWIRAMKRKEEGFSYSLFLSHLYESLREHSIANIRSQFPRGIPSIYNDNYFLLEQAIERFANDLRWISQPFLGYFHFWPPHAPYLTHQEFFNRFKDDGWNVNVKPDNVFSKNKERISKLYQYRMEYDEFILYVDREFGKFMEQLESTGMTANTWVVFTSDHGEMFERGIVGHKTPVLYEPIIRVPLLIFEPGRKSREDVYTPTSAVDLLSTLLHIAGQPSAGWSEGVILPPFNNHYAGESKNIYVLEAAKNQKYQPFSIATAAMIRDRYKLTYFWGYEELGGEDGELVELYDLENDPEEFNNLYLSKRETGLELLNELKAKLAKVDKPYRV